MTNEQKKKDVWDKMASVTPLLLGILVTGIGALFTHVYNFQQLQLNQIAALNNLRPLLTAENPQDREFAYSSFVALGYEGLAIRLIEIQRDQTGRSVLVQLKNAGPAETREKAAAALEVLDEAQKLVNIFEFGKPEGNEASDQQDPSLAAAFEKGKAWAQDAARELGISSKLGIAILFDTAAHIGVRRAQKLKEMTSKSMPPPLDTQDKEKAWLTEYLDQRNEAMKKGPAAAFYPAIKKHRIDKLRNLIEAGDWDLNTIE